MGKFLYNQIQKQRRERRLARRVETVAAALCVHGILVFALSLLRNSIRDRAYLTKEALLPLSHSPWRKLLASGTNAHFITVTGLSRDAFMTLLAKYHEHFEDRPKGLGIKEMSLLSIDSLALVLHWLNSTMRQKTLKQLFGLPNVSRPLSYALDALLRTLRAPSFPEAAVRWPTHEEMEQWAELVEIREEGCIRGIFGTLTHFSHLLCPHLVHPRLC